MCHRFPKGLLFLWEHKNRTYIRNLVPRVWGSVSPFQYGGERPILDPDAKVMALIRDWAAMWVSWKFYSTSSNFPPWGHHVMVPTGVTNVFDELHEVSSRNGAYG